MVDVTTRYTNSEIKQVVAGKLDSIYDTQPDNDTANEVPITLHYLVSGHKSHNTWI